MAYGAILGQKPIVTPDFPIGGIIIWSGSEDNIPENWHLCDGTNGTPNLRDRFVLGAGSTYDVGAAGGEAAHTLTTLEIPAHNHALELNYSYVQDGTTASGIYSTSGSYSDTETTQNAGGGAAHNNMPPYYALCYIMKIS